MTSPAFSRFLPDVAARLPWVGLAAGPTPVERLAGLGRLLGHDRLFVKREDRTDARYGGNKVRNLEFLLGDALARGARRIVTVAPLGSNFVAALAAQAAKVEIAVEVAHFVPARSPQIEAHAAFAAAHGARLSIHEGRRGLVPAALEALARCVAPGAYWIAPGGSNAVGTLGPLSAALEFADQVERGAAPAPEVVIVGVGTCGTMAGLLAGFALAGLRAHVIGIRCVDRLVCRRGRVAALANAALARLGRPPLIRAADVDLRDGFNSDGYGHADAAARAAAEALDATEGIRLDTTYTAKVVAALVHGARADAWTGRTVLYWHTFSPAALAARAARRVPDTVALDQPH